VKNHNRNAEQNTVLKQVEQNTLHIFFNFSYFLKKAEVLKNSKCTPLFFSDSEN